MEGFSSCSLTEVEDEEEDEEEELISVTSCVGVLLTFNFFSFLAFAEAVPALRLFSL